MADETTQNPQTGETPEIPSNIMGLITELSLGAQYNLMGFDFQNNKQDPEKINLPMAKHYIDYLLMLKEKTKGNLTIDEGNMLSHQLTQLELEYVRVSNQKKAANP
jgi:hypothetical protein